MTVLAHKKARRAQGGVGLIEVLVAVLVFAVGMLGLAAMQVAAKRQDYEATQRSVATSLVSDILERMRANPQQLPVYALAELGPETAALAKHCGVSVCTTAELAAYDLYEWGRLLGGSPEVGVVDGISTAVGGLVDPRACISHNAGEVTVTVVWRGVDPLQNLAAAPCGEATGLYGGDNELRRLLSIATYIGGL